MFGPLIGPKARLYQIFGAACVEALGICIPDGATAPKLLKEIPIKL